MAHWGANHGAINYGHIGTDLITLASMLRIPVNKHNVDLSLIHISGLRHEAKFRNPQAGAAGSRFHSQHPAGMRERSLQSVRASPRTWARQIFRRWSYHSRPPACQNIPLTWFCCQCSFRYLSIVSSDIFHFRLGIDVKRTVAIKVPDPAIWPDTDVLPVYGSCRCLLYTSRCV